MLFAPGTMSYHLAQHYRVALEDLSMQGWGEVEAQNGTVAGMNY